METIISTQGKGKRGRDSTRSFFENQIADKESTLTLHNGLKLLHIVSSLCLVTVYRKWLVNKFSYLTKYVKTLISLVLVYI